MAGIKIQKYDTKKAAQKAAMKLANTTDKTLVQVGKRVFILKG